MHISCSCIPNLIKAIVILLAKKSPKACANSCFYKEFS